MNSDKSTNPLGFNQLVQDLGLEARCPSERPLYLLLPPAQAAGPLKGVGLLGRPPGNPERYAGASGFFLWEEDKALEAFCLREGLGLVLLPPWVRPEALVLEVQKRLLARQEAWILAGLLEVLPRLMDRPFLELLYHAAGLSLARVAPWGEVLAFAGTPPPEHPRSPGAGRGHLALEAGEGVLVAYGPKAQLEEARGLLELAARLLRLKDLERALERMQEESLGGVALEAVLLGEAEPERLRAFGIEETVEWVLALLEPPPVPGQHRLAEARRREATLELRRRAGGYLDRLGVPYLLGTRGNRVVALWQVHSEHREALALLKALPEGSRLGYSLVHTGFGLQEAYREALIALKAARPGEAVSFAGLDPVAYFLLQQTPEDLKALTERFLPLSEKLLKTLEVYLEAPSLEEAARRLHIHPNTLRYRLARVEKVMGSLKAPEILARLYLAFRARALLQG